MPCRSFGFAIAVSAALATGAQAADLRLLSSWDKTNPAVGALAEPFARGVETGTKGSVKFVISGPETVPPFEQLQPVSTGVFQILSAGSTGQFSSIGCPDAVPASANPSISA